MRKSSAFFMQKIKNLTLLLINHKFLGCFMEIIDYI